MFWYKVNHKVKDLLMSEITEASKGYPSHCAKSMNVYNMGIDVRTFLMS